MRSFDRSASAAAADTVDDDASEKTLHAASGPTGEGPGAGVTGQTETQGNVAAPSIAGGKAIGRRGHDSTPSFAHQALPDSFDRELGHFLALFTERFGIKATGSDACVTLEFPPNLLGTAAPAGPVSLPLGEEALLRAGLRPEGLSLNPVRLLALCLGKGSHARLRALPRVSAARAGKCLDDPSPELIHRPVFVLHLLLSLRYFRKEEAIFAFVFDATTGQELTQLTPVLAPPLWLDEGIGPALDFDRVAHRLPELYARSKHAVGVVKARRLAQIKAQLDQEAQESIKILDDYYEEKARELEDERKGVYFHLYYFEKEEEIDQQLASIHSEREERARALRGHCDLSAAERLISVGYFEIPFWRSRGTGAQVDGLLGSVVLDATAMGAR